MILRIRDALRRRSTLNAKASKKPPKEQTTETNLPTKTVTPSAAVAAEAVLKTPELLELVLAHLDQEQLMSAQRVCRRWKDIINSSLPLRRMLYLSPALKVDEHIPVDNAWLKRRFPDFGIYLLQGNPKWRPKYIRALGPTDFARLGDDFFKADASWRDMLLTQPPVKEMVVYSHIEESSKATPKKSMRISFTREEEQRQPSTPSLEEMIKASVTIKSQSGITMGMIVDAGVEARRRGSIAAKRQVSDRKDSGYVSLENSQVEEIEVSVVEVVSP